MFKNVHHVHYVVPSKLEDLGDRGKDAVYRVGPTLIEFTEPADFSSGVGEHLQKNGPGVYHVSWAVDNIQQVAKDLMSKGNRLRGETGVTQSPRGYQAANINVEDSHGLWFQMSEGDAT